MISAHVNMVQFAELHEFVDSFDWAHDGVLRVWLNAKGVCGAIS